MIQERMVVIQGETVEEELVWGWGRWMGKKEEEAGGREGGRMCVYTRGLIYVTDMCILAKETQCCCL